MSVYTKVCLSFNFEMNFLWSFYVQFLSKSFAWIVFSKYLYELMDRGTYVTIRSGRLYAVFMNLVSISMVQWFLF